VRRNEEGGRGVKKTSYFWSVYILTTEISSHKKILFRKNGFRKLLKT
jgi:hypothetical protein